LFEEKWHFKNKFQKNSVQMFSNLHEYKINDFQKYIKQDISLLVIISYYYKNSTITKQYYYQMGKL